MRLARYALIVVAICSFPFIIAAQEKTEPAAAPGAAASAKGATGTWKWSFQGPGGNDVTMTLKLKQDSEKLTGTVTGFGGQETEIQDGSVKDGQVTFKVVRDFAGTKSTTTYTAALAEGSLKGKSETVFTREFDAKREEK